MGVCLKHKETITCLDFDYTNNSTLKKKKNVVYLSTLSSAFENITELSFRNYFDKDLTFIQVQEAFPNLTIFYFKSNYLLSNEIVRTYLDKIGDSVVYFNTSIKKLEIATYLSTCYIKYLTKCLPNQLEKHE